MKKKVALLVDGDFYLRVCRRNNYPKSLSPEDVAQNLWYHCIKHIDKDSEELYRIFFYDCPPLEKKHMHPITRKSVDFANSETAIFRKELHIELVKKPYLALRRGRLSEAGYPWRINQDKYEALIKKKISMDDIQSEDVFYAPVQKGVDMKIGLDIAHLSYKQLVQKIVLISGDSDFVAAAKVARREGIHFVLDPLYSNISTDLSEHIDKLYSPLYNNKKKNKE